MKNTDWLIDVRDCPTLGSGKPGRVFPKKWTSLEPQKVLGLWLADFYTWDCNTGQRDHGTPLHTRTLIKPTNRMKGKSYPIGSMYGIFTYIYHKNQLNVGKYTMHGSYGYVVFNAHVSSRNLQTCPPTILMIPESRDPWNKSSPRIIDEVKTSKTQVRKGLFGPRSSGVMKYPLNMIAPSGKLPSLKLSFLLWKLY